MEEMMSGLTWAGSRRKRSETLCKPCACAQVDRDLDASTPNAGEMMMEKMISGMYMGEVARRLLLRLAVLLPRACLLPSKCQGRSHETLLEAFLRKYVGIRQPSSKGHQSTGRPCRACHFTLLQHPIRLRLWQRRDNTP